MAVRASSWNFRKHRSLIWGRQSWDPRYVLKGPEEKTRNKKKVPERDVQDKLLAWRRCLLAAGCRPQ